LLKLGYNVFRAHGVFSSRVSRSRRSASAACATLSPELWPPDGRPGRILRVPHHAPPSYAYSVEVLMARIQLEVQ
jgi:hypothetical protein